MEYREPLPENITPVELAWRGMLISIQGSGLDKETAIEMLRGWGATEEEIQALDEEAES